VEQFEEADSLPLFMVKEERYRIYISRSRKEKIDEDLVVGEAKQRVCLRGTDPIARRRKHEISCLMILILAY
jgi:hypothetical protein